METNRRHSGWHVFGVSALIVGASAVVLYLGMWALIAFTFRDSGRYNKHPMLFEELNYEAPKSEVWWDIVDDHVTLYFTDCQTHSVSRLSLLVQVSGPVEKGDPASLEAVLHDVVVPPKGLPLETVLPGSDMTDAPPSRPPVWAASVTDVQGGLKTGQISFASLKDGSIEWTGMPSVSAFPSTAQHQKVQACPRR